VPGLSSLLNGILVPWATVLPKPLQRLQLPALSSQSRLNYTDGIVLEHIISQFTGDEPTIREFFEGSHFTKSIETEQDPRFPGALKDWSHPADFVWPPSLRCWRVARCEKLVYFVQNVMKKSGARASAGVRESISAILFVRAVLSGGAEHRPDIPADYMNLFASPDMGRVTPAHLHGFPSHNLLLVVKGKKRMVEETEEEANKAAQDAAEAAAKAAEAVQIAAEEDAKLAEAAEAVEAAEAAEAEYNLRIAAVEKDEANKAAQDAAEAAAKAAEAVQIAA